MDVLIVGAGPAGLACAIELARLVKRDQEAGGALAELKIAVLEKAGGLGEHNLSGAVVNPRAFRELFPELKDADFPFRQPVTAEAVLLADRDGAQSHPDAAARCRTTATTPPRSARSCAGWASRPRSWASTCFAGFPVDALLVEGDAVRGVPHHALGSRPRRPARPGYDAADRPHRAKVTVLAEGTRGPLGQAWREWQQVGSRQPAALRARREGALGDEAPARRGHPHAGLAAPARRVRRKLHVPARPNQVALGLVVGLDYHDATLDVHELLQRMKLHPLFRQQLEGGRAGRVGREDDPRGRLLRPARAPRAATGC